MDKQELLEIAQWMGKTVYDEGSYIDVIDSRLDRRRQWHPDNDRDQAMEILEWMFRWKHSKDVLDRLGVFMSQNATIKQAVVRTALDYAREAFYV